jgi:signal peptidase II
MNPSRVLRAALVAATVVSTIGCDQATKHIARTQLAGAPPLSFLRGSVRFALAHNEGGFLSLGASLAPSVRTAIFVVGVGTALALTALFLLRSRQLPFPAQLCGWLIWAGGASNLVDRVLLGGRVTDFLVLGLGPVRTGVFNAADVAIVAGGIFLALFAWLQPEPPAAETPEVAHEPTRDERDASP